MEKLNSEFESQGLKWIIDEKEYVIYIVMIYHIFFIFIIFYSRKLKLEITSSVVSPEIVELLYHGNCSIVNDTFKSSIMPPHDTEGIMFPRYKKIIT